MRYFRHKNGFKDATDYIKCSDDGKHTWLVNKDGCENKSIGYDLLACLKFVKDGEYEEIFLDEIKGMKKDTIEIKDVVVILSLGRPLNDDEVKAIEKLEDVHLIVTETGQIEVTIPNKKSSTLEIDLIKRKILRAIELARYRMATDEEAKELWATVDIWFENAPKAGNFRDCKGITERSVAEFLANQKGFSLFTLE